MSVSVASCRLGKLRSSFVLFGLLLHAGITFSEMSKILGKMWRNVDKAEKEELMARHHHQRKVYEAEVQRLTLLQTNSFAQSISQKDIKAGTSSKKGKLVLLQSSHIQRPKRPTSAYLYFTLEGRQKIRDEHPELSFTDVARALGAKWKKMSLQQRAVRTFCHCFLPEPLPSFCSQVKCALLHQPYVALYEADKQRFKEEEKEWKSKLCKKS